MKLTKEKINNFFEIYDYLEQNQKGAFGIGCLNRFQLMVLKYVGMGEGMEYETAEKYDLKDLKEELYKKVEE